MRLTGLTKLLIGSALTGSLAYCDMKEKPHKNYLENNSTNKEQELEEVASKKILNENKLERQFSPSKDIMNLLHKAHGNTNLLKMPCSTRFMTDGKEKVFNSWFNLMEYFNTAPLLKKDEFETESEYKNRLQKVNKIEKDFTIYFIPVLGEYSHEEQGFTFELSFFLSKNKSTNPWNEVRHDKKYFREKVYIDGYKRTFTTLITTDFYLRYNNDFLITSKKWPTEIRSPINWEINNYKIAEVRTKYKYFIKVDDLEKARLIRENENKIIGTLTGILESVKKVEDIAQKIGNKEVVEKDEELIKKDEVHTAVTVYTINAEELKLEIKGTKYKW